MLKNVNYIFIFSLVLSLPSAAQIGQRDAGFWDKVRFGGGFGLGFGDDYFSASLSPSAIYQFNPYFSAGPGLNFTYVKNDFLKSTLVGGSLIFLANPYPAVQLSAEIEELYVSRTSDLEGVDFGPDIWNTALFLGAGYRAGPATIGLRYNVLFSEEDRVYASAFQPFVRFYF